MVFKFSLKEFQTVVKPTRCSNFAEAPLANRCLCVQKRDVHQLKERERRERLLGNYSYISYLQYWLNGWTLKILNDDVKMANLLFCHIPVYERCIFQYNPSFESIKYLGQMSLHKKIIMEMKGELSLRGKKDVAISGLQNPK